MAKRILVDFHHGYLLESLCMLFEDRLGWELYRPIGTDWYSEGYWLVFDAMDTAMQYLSVEKQGATKQAGSGEACDDWKNKGAIRDDRTPTWLVPSLEFRPRAYRAVELSVAKEMSWDLILSSTPDHFPRYERFRQQFAPKTPHVWQCGNPWSAPTGARHVLNSTTSPMPPWVNEVRYHQEFDSKARFTPDPACRRDTVTNLLHYGDVKRFHEVEAMLPSMRFLAHGAGNRDKSIPEDKFRDVLRHETSTVWHCKPEDGYGFNLHTAAACGKPIVCNAQKLKHQMAGPLLVPNETCLDLDTMDNGMIAAFLGGIPEDYAEISARVRKRFEEVVNFDEEFTAIQRWLERIL